MTFKGDKRAREVRKLIKREKKAERKRLRKAGMLGSETPGEPKPPAPAPGAAAPESEEGEEPKA